MAEFNVGSMFSAPKSQMFRNLRPAAQTPAVPRPAQGGGFASAALGTMGKKTRPSGLRRVRSSFTQAAQGKAGM